MPLPVVTCARCCRPVDELVVSHNPATRSVEISALCHGDVDRMTIGQFDLMALQRGAAIVTEATAFDRKALPENSP